jgi:hypothetical protein
MKHVQDARLPLATALLGIALLVCCNMPLVLGADESLKSTVSRSIRHRQHNGHVSHHHRSSRRDRRFLSSADDDFAEEEYYYNEGWDDASPPSEDLGEEGDYYGEYDDFNPEGSRDDVNPDEEYDYGASQYSHDYAYDDYDMWYGRPRNGTEFWYYDDYTLDDYPFMDDDFLPPEQYGAGSSYGDTPEYMDDQAYNSYYYYEGSKSKGNDDDDDDVVHINKMNVDRNSNDDTMYKQQQRSKRSKSGIPLWSYGVVILISLAMSCCAAGCLYYMNNAGRGGAPRDSYKFKKLSTRDDIEMVPYEEEDDADL